MNCHEFRLHHFDVAAHRHAIPAPATSNDNALRHAALCAACAHLLAEQRELSAQLRQLASVDAHCGPLPEQEHALRAAYQSAYQASNEPAAASSTGNWKIWAGAIAAMLLLTLAGIALSQKVPGWFATGSAAQSAKVAVAGPLPIAEIPRTLTTPTVPRSPSVPRASRKSPQQAREASSPAAIHAALTSATDISAEQPTGWQAARPVSQESSSEEAASDFVPLPYDGDPMLAGSGPIVRVEITGAALRSLGLSLGFPIATESSGRLVQADLVLGQDGLARAIRFVQ